MSTSDKISKLPDDILLDVLLCLDLTHAAQTSVLAKRWRYLWTLQTDLNLHPANTNFNDEHFLISEIGSHDYLNCINQVLDAHRAPRITKCSFYFRYPFSTDLSYVEKWARFALSKRVTDLELYLFANSSCTRFSLGFDILKHPPYYNGIVNLKSLRLTFVDISGEVLEFILLQCRLLEVLYVSGSKTLQALNIVSDKLKHLTLITMVWLKELHIDAVNIISFHHQKTMYADPSTHIVFNRLPKLVDMSFECGVCQYPFSFLGQFSYLFNQLTKLSFHPILDLDRSLLPKCSDVRLEFDMLFPNAKQLTLTVELLNWAAIIFSELFIKACPVLRELKLQVTGKLFRRAGLKEEAKQLQEIELDDEIIDDTSKEGNPYSQAQEEKVKNYVVGEENGSNIRGSNLKALEIVGFHGCDDDIKWILDVIADSYCLQTLICDPRCPRVIGEHWEPEGDVATTEEIRRRARKLCKLVSRSVRIGVRDMNGLFWVN